MDEISGTGFDDIDEELERAGQELCAGFAALGMLRLPPPDLSRWAGTAHRGTSPPTRTSLPARG